jgi:DNA-binding NarL/FixJ family response regulator
MKTSAHGSSTAILDSVIQNGTVKLMLVEDHPIMRIGIASLVAMRRDFQLVAQAGSGEEAILLHHEHQPDVTLMDLRLPGISGEETIRTIRRRSPKARFIILTTYEGDEDIHQALQAGAGGYVIKGMPHEILMNAILKVHSGGVFLPPTVRRRLAARTPGTELNSRERDVLVRIAQGKSNKEIALELGIAEITVKCRVSTILDRLNVNDRTQAIVIALQRGLLHF